jgi:hypothetical protein
LWVSRSWTFKNIGRAHPRRRIEALELELDLIQRTDTFLSDRQVKLVLVGEVGRHNRWTWVWEGLACSSPLAVGVRWFFGALAWRFLVLVVLVRFFLSF